MKNSITRMSAVLAAVVALGAGLQTSAASSFVSYEWRFSTGLNPAIPEASSGGTGAAQAVIAPGEFASGWLANNGVLGAANGVWDLGRNGSITLSNPAGLAGNSSQERQVTLRVVQYQDGAIYDQLASASIPGATLVSSNSSFSAAATIGDWVVQITQWRAPAGAALNSVAITSSYYGSLIDGITLETSDSLVAPPVLSIRRVGPNNGQVEISWPASYSNMVLESAGNLSASPSWAPVQAPVQVNGNVRFVTLDATGGARFYRLKQ
jgi:hypothetical protein